MTGLVLRLILALVLVVVACDAPPPLLRTCDVRQRECQREVFQALHQLRGQLWDPWTSPPPVVVLSPAQLRQLSDIELGPPAASGSEWTAPLRELGLLPADLDVVQADRRWYAENTIAAYWPTLKVVTLVDNNSVFDSPDSVAVLVHEYMHAAQDREFNLGSTDRKLTTDVEMVRMALIEGEARLFQTIARLSLMNADAGPASIHDQIQRELVGVRRQSPSAPALHPHVRRRLPYPIGGAFFTEAWQRGGSPGVNRVFARPPSSFVDLLLASEGLPAPGARPVELCEPVFPEASIPWLDRDTLGAGLLYATLLTLSGNEEGSWEASLTWRADRMWIYRHPVHGAVRLWRVQAPGLARTTLGPSLASRTAPPRLEGDDLLYWSPDLPNLIEALRASQRCEAPR